MIGFYGLVHQKIPEDQEAPVLHVDEYECPVLGLFGGADQAIPVEAVRDFESALDRAGVQNEITVYDGAPHSFFDRTHEQFRVECDDAWSRMLRFVGAAATA